jgi:hypothetical protein
MAALGEIGDGSEFRSSRAVYFVGRNQFVEFADDRFFQHLAAPMTEIGDVEPALLDVQDALDVEQILLAVKRHFQQDQIFGGRHADDTAVKRPFNGPLQERVLSASDLPAPALAAKRANAPCGALRNTAPYFRTPPFSAGSEMNS